MTPEEFAERALLGVLVRNPERVSEVGPHLDQWDFTAGWRWATFALIRDHHPRLAELAQQARAAGQHQPDQWARIVAAALPELAHEAVADTAAELAGYMALAPPHGGQPAVYAELLIEASIRRQVAMLGYDAARLSAQTPQVAELLAAQETITAHLASAQQRWDAITQTRDLVRALTADPEPAANGRVDLDLFGRPVLPTPATPPPSPDAVHAAQEQVIGAILTSAGVADTLLGRLEPTDFLNQELGNALDAAKQVHAQAAVSGRQVDPVTVAWAAQTLPDERGPTPPPEYLHELAATAELKNLDAAVDLVMRASLAKLTAQAAATTQQAARQAGVAPGDVLAAARSAYQTVDAAARRLTGRAPTAYQLGVLDNRASTGAPTTTDLAGLRSRSATLRQEALAPQPRLDNGLYHGIGARLDTATGTESPTSYQEVHPDAGPGPA